jgi:hypothetical protein
MIKRPANGPILIGGIAFGHQPANGTTAKGQQ